MRYQDFKKPSDFKTPQEFHEYYKSDIRPAMNDAHTVRATYDLQAQRYKEDRLPTDPHSVELARQEKLLGIYKTTLAEAKLGDRVHGVNRRRVADYERIVAETEALISANSATRRFELSEAYKTTAKHRDAVAAVAVDDEAKNLVSLAWDSFVATQDAKVFRAETESIIKAAESAESSRKFHADMDALRDKIRGSQAATTEIQTSHDNDAAIRAARGGISE